MGHCPSPIGIWHYGRSKGQNLRGSPGWACQKPGNASPSDAILWDAPSALQPVQTLVNRNGLLQADELVKS